MIKRALLPVYIYWCSASTNTLWDIFISMELIPLTPFTSIGVFENTKERDALHLLGVFRKQSVRVYLPITIICKGFNLIILNYYIWMNWLLKAYSQNILPFVEFSKISLQPRHKVILGQDPTSNRGTLATNWLHRPKACR